MPKPRSPAVKPEHMFASGLLPCYAFQRGASGCFLPFYLMRPTFLLLNLQTLTVAYSGHRKTPPLLTG